MPLVERVAGKETSAETESRSLALVESLGKQAVRVTDSPGFATSRLGVALGLEAMRMLEEGVANAADIDRAMALGYGHRMGPLKTSDLVGSTSGRDRGDARGRAAVERFSRRRSCERCRGKTGRSVEASSCRTAKKATGPGRRWNCPANRNERRAPRTEPGDRPRGGGGYLLLKREPSFRGRRRSCS
jgi:3-hydroxyacyl-CoA dehydrogenase